MHFAIGASPANEDLAGAPRFMIEHALDPKERVRCKRADGWALAIVRVPAGEARVGPLHTTPIGILLGENDIVIVSGADHAVVAALRKLAIPGTSTSACDVMVEALHAVARSFAETVEAIELAIDQVEERLASSLRNTEVLELLRYQKALVLHSAALHALGAMLDRLPEVLRLGDGATERLADVAVELRQTMEVADLERQTLSDTMDAFASIIANNLNDVMRVLAAVAVVLTPPMIIASFWGMNTPLPMQSQPFAFGALVALSLTISGVMAIWLRRRRWL